MSDVVAVALISAGASLVGAVVVAVANSRASRRNSETTIATENARKEVELAKIEAENRRLQIQHREDERRNRRETYHQTLTTMQRIYSIEGDSKDWAQVTGEWRRCRAGVQIFGSKEASRTLDEVQDVVWKNPLSFEADGRKKWEEEFKEVSRRFIDVLRADVGLPEGD